MTTVSVWAPEAEEVLLDCAGARAPMTRQDGGWWRLESAVLAHGVDYAFHVDGNGPFPDPRSPPGNPMACTGPRAGWITRPSSGAIRAGAHHLWPRQ